MGLPDWEVGEVSGGAGGRGEGLPTMRPYRQRVGEPSLLVSAHPVGLSDSPGSACCPAIRLQDQERSQIWLQKLGSPLQAPLGSGERDDPGQLWPFEASTERKPAALWGHCGRSPLSFGSQRAPWPRVFHFGSPPPSHVAEVGGTVDHHALWGMASFCLRRSLGWPSVMEVASGRWKWGPCLSRLPFCHMGVGMDRLIL